MARILRYLHELIKWNLYGRPRRSHQDVQNLFNICESCDKFIEYDTEEGECGVCGCSLKRDSNDIHFNKLSWGTTHCPLKKW